MSWAAILAVAALLCGALLFTFSPVIKRIIVGRLPRLSDEELVARVLNRPALTRQQWIDGRRTVARSLSVPPEILDPEMDLTVLAREFTVLWMDLLDLDSLIESLFDRRPDLANRERLTVEDVIIGMTKPE